MSRGHKSVHPHDSLGRGITPSLGITLREHYAGLALQGLASITVNRPKEDVAARVAVSYADALIEALGE
jgi:hypothetical protein